LVATAAKTDYYEVLGVERDADEEAIRQAFRALARECHPDIAQAPHAEQRFRELAEAYSVLSKRESRLLYDRYGYRGRGNQGLDEALWDVGPHVERGESVHIPLELKLYEAEQGTRRLVRYEVAVRCDACAGRGVAGEPDPDCEVCGGTGRQQDVADLDVASLLQVAPCPVCGSACKHCGRSGMVSSERRLRLAIPPGIEDCAQLRVSGEGHYGGWGSVPGDLLVHVSVLPGPRDPRLVRYTAFILLIAALATLVVYVATH
jgi:molecular chaperone DnaJ